MRAVPGGGDSARGSRVPPPPRPHRLPPRPIPRPAEGGIGECALSGPREEDDHVPLEDAHTGHAIFRDQGAEAVIGTRLSGHRRDAAPTVQPRSALTTM